MDMTALVSQLLFTLQLLTGYQVSAPEVQQKSRAEIGAILCPVSKCAPYSAYRESVVYLSHDVDLSTPKGRSTLYHELVHHAQEKGTHKGQRHVASGDACSESVAREHEAYAAQNQYLSEIENSGLRAYYNGRCW